MTEAKARGASLLKVGTNLRAEFKGVFNVERIDQVLHSSYDQFAADAQFFTFLPLLAKRFAWQPLQAPGEG